MRLKVRSCPKGCIKPNTKNRRVKLVVISTHERKKRTHDYQYFILLNWHCPLCGYIEPISERDQRRDGRYPLSHTAAGVRKQYE
jgi:hypothetical protein